MKKVLSTLVLLVIFLFPLWGQYKYVKVSAPFPMKPIKEFIYPSKDFSIVDYGAVEGAKIDVTDAIEKAIVACN